MSKLVGTLSGLLAGAMLATAAAQDPIPVTSVHYAGRYDMATHTFFPSDIDPDAPLYREGLGLDSIDILEVALVVSKRYGFKLRDDDKENVRIFRSLRSLAAHVAERRVK